jgi:acetyl esterase/lipase
MRLTETVVNILMRWQAPPETAAWPSVARHSDLWGHLFRIKGMRIFRAAFLAALLPACTPLGILDYIVPDNGYRPVVDISYGSHHRQALDLYLPNMPAAKPAPVVLFFYGGSWKNGQRAHYRFVGQALASQGIAVAVADYRLFPEVRFPAFVEDGAKALAMLHQTAPKYGLDRDRIFLAGHSAGAHLAALLAFNPHYLKDAGLDKSAIAGFIGLAGPYAFNPLSYEASREVFQPAKDNIDTARPVTFANKESPPALLLHGKEDETVVSGNTETLARRLNQVGVKAVVRLYPDIGPAGIVLAMAKPFQGKTPVIEDIIDFIASRKKGGILSTKSARALSTTD